MDTQGGINKIDMKMSKPLDSYLEGAIKLKIYARKNKELKYHKEHLLKEAKAYEDNLFYKDICNYIRDFDIDNFLSELDFESKRDLLDLFIRKIEVDHAVSSGNRHSEKRIKIYWKI